jgi:hypothetical protein
MKPGDSESLNLKEPQARNWQQACGDNDRLQAALA